MHATRPVGAVDDGIGGDGAGTGHPEPATRHQDTAALAESGVVMDRTVVVHRDDAVVDATRPWGCR